VRALRNRGFNPRALVQTIDGACEALGRGKTWITERANAGDLERAGDGRFTTRSILNLFAQQIADSKANSDNSTAGGAI
jgi:hypothetical protein